MGGKRAISSMEHRHFWIHRAMSRRWNLEPRSMSLWDYQVWRIKRRFLFWHAYDSLWSTKRLSYQKPKQWACCNLHAPSEAKCQTLGQAGKPARRRFYGAKNKDHTTCNPLVVSNTFSNVHPKWVARWCQLNHPGMWTNGPDKGRPSHNINTQLTWVKFVIIEHPPGTLWN